MELTRTIWEGQDYIPYVWEDWLADPQGLLAIAEFGGKIVGTGKLTRLSDQDWWLEGLRVHTKYQGKGIASHLNDYLLQVWLRSGGGTVRLATSSLRLAVHHLSERRGFSKIAEFSAFVAPVITEATNNFTLVEENEIPEALEDALDSQSLGWSTGLMDLGWQWAIPRESYIIEAIRRGQAWWWQGRRGLLVIWEDEENQETRPAISLVACPAADMAMLLLDYRRLAWKSGYKQASWIAPIHSALLPVLIGKRFSARLGGGHLCLCSPAPNYSGRIIYHTTRS
jgi:GNAT superfamily N-acetyltransferase